MPCIVLLWSVQGDLANGVRSRDSHLTGADPDKHETGHSITDECRAPQSRVPSAERRKEGVGEGRRVATLEGSLMPSQGALNAVYSHSWATCDYLWALTLVMPRKHGVASRLTCFVPNLRLPSTHAACHVEPASLLQELYGAAAHSGVFHGQTLPVCEVVRCPYQVQGSVEEGIGVSEWPVSQTQTGSELWQEVCTGTHSPQPIDCSIASQVLQLLKTSSISEMRGWSLCAGCAESNYCAGQPMSIWRTARCLLTLALFMHHYNR